MASLDNTEQSDTSSDSTQDSSEAVIMSRSGTVRGIHKGVQQRCSMFNTFGQGSVLSDLMLKLLGEELPNPDTGYPGKVVMYTTSLTAKMEVSSNCARVKQILTTHRISFDERDIFLHPGFLDELKERLSTTEIVVPYVFYRGSLVGDRDKIEFLNDDGELLPLLKDFQQKEMKSCSTCGDRRFVLCNWCQGSKKGLKNNFGYLKCTVCNVNGLQPCSACSASS